jgi:predicted nucleotidyltransferase
VIEVRSEIGKSTSASIVLELPWVYATELARLIAKAARSLDHAALDAIAELLDGKEWSGADDLDTIAALVRHTGREVRDVPEDRAEEEDEDQVLCRFCQRPSPARTAHRYQGGWVGDECCWDERLRSSE